MVAAEFERGRYGTPMTRPDTSAIAPLFIVRNVPAALSFYHDRLGFLSNASPPRRVTDHPVHRQVHHRGQDLRQHRRRTDFQVTCCLSLTLRAEANALQDP